MNEEITLAEAKKILADNLTKGTKCPCCNRHTQMYSRKITSSMAYGLIIIHKYRERTEDEYKDYYTNIESLFNATKNIPASIRGDIPKLRFWNLIEPQTESAGDGNPNSGFYRITTAGIDFVNRKSTVESKILVYNNQMYGFAKDSKKINIVEALGSKFNYNELMGHEKV